MASSNNLLVTLLRIAVPPRCCFGAGPWGGIGSTTAWGGTHTHTHLLHRCTSWLPYRLSAYSEKRTMYEPWNFMQASSRDPNRLVVFNTFSHWCKSRTSRGCEDAPEDDFEEFRWDMLACSTPTNRSPTQKHSSIKHNLLFDRMGGNCPVQIANILQDANTWFEGSCSWP